MSLLQVALYDSYSRNIDKDPSIHEEMTRAKIFVFEFWLCRVFEVLVVISAR